MDGNRKKEYIAPKITSNPIYATLTGACSFCAPAGPDTGFVAVQTGDAGVAELGCTHYGSFGNS